MVSAVTIAILLQCVFAQRAVSLFQQRFRSRHSRTSSGRDLREDSDQNLIAKLTVETGPISLLDFCLASMPNMKRSQVKQWMATGAIYVNQEMQKQFDFKLFAGDSVNIRSWKTNANGKSSHQRASIDISVLYEDQNMLVVDKPVGMLTAPHQFPTNPTQANPMETLFSRANAYMTTRYGKQQTAKLFVVHTLEKVKCI